MMTWPAHCIGHSAGAEIMSVLKTLYSRFQILDTSFPMLTFSWLHEDVTAVFDPDRVPNMAERQFYSRFRQAGGHMPLLRFSDLGSASYSHAASVEQAGSTTIIACHGRDCSSLLDFIGDVSPDTTLLVNDPDNDETMNARLTRMGFIGRLTVRFNRPSRVETFRLIARKAFDQPATNSVMRTTKTFAVDVGFDVMETDLLEPLISVELPAVGYQPAAVAMSPKRLIHDGSRRSEGASDYSWLWVGKERHIRVLLGHVPAHFKRIRVIVPNAVTTANLKTARLALNGQIVEPAIEIWRDGCGAVSAELEFQAGGDQVLGFSVAHAKAIEAGTAPLAACIDRIEFQA